MNEATTRIDPAEHLWLAKQCVSNFIRKHPGYYDKDIREDMFQTACLAMTLAAKKYRETRCKWTTYAYSYMEGYLKDFVSKNRLVHVPRYLIDHRRSHCRAPGAEGRKVNEQFVRAANHIMTACVEPLKVDKIGGRESESQQEKLDWINTCITKAISHLNRRDRQIIVAYYGLDGSEPRSGTVIGKKMGISRQRVHELMRRAIEIMREALATTEGAA